MSESTETIPEEDAGIEVGTTNADYDKGDEIPNSLDTEEFTASFEGVWRHNTGEIYKATSSAIDEGLGNAITAVRRANKIFDAWDAGVIVRIVEKSDDEVYLTIRDEGVGMTKDLIDNVLTDIGTTTGLVGENANSKFGRGFLSLYMLVGEGRKDASGSFTMSTNPRFDDSESEIEPPYNLLLRPGELSYVSSIPCELDSDEYGTRLRFCVRDGISADDLEEWVRDYGTYSRTPIMLERVNPDGSMENDELGGKRIEDSYDDSCKVIVERDGLYRAVASPEAEGKVVILDAQTDTNSSLSFPVYRDWNIDIRLLSEDGPIFESSDESKIGKIPLREEELEDVPENERNRYISKDKYNEYEDKCMDEPSGTRDIIELSDEFLESVVSRLKHKVEKKVEEATSDLSEAQDWFKLSNKESKLLGSIISRRRHRWNIDSLVDNETLEVLNTLSKSANVVNEGISINNPKSVQRTKMSSEYIYNIEEKYDDIYYGHSILERRAKAVWSDGNNAVVRVKPKRYDELDQIGWTKITEVTSRSVEDMDVSKDVVGEFKQVYEGSSGNYSSVADDYDDREVRIHHGQYSSTITAKVGEIRNNFGDDISGYESNLNSKVGRIVVFTSTSDHSISNHKELVDEYTATIKCVNKVFEENLSHLSDVIKYENYGNHDEDYQVLTNDGEISVSQLSQRNVRLFHTSSDWKNWLKQSHKETSVNVLDNLLPQFEGTIAIVSSYDLHAIRPKFKILSPKTRQNGYTTENQFSVSHKDKTIEFKGESKPDTWYRMVKARVPEWTDKTEVRCMISDYDASDENTKKKILSRFGRMYDSGEKLASDKHNDSTPTVNQMVIETNRGRMTADEIKESDDELVIIPANDFVKDKIDEIPIEVLEEYINEKVSSKYYRSIQYSQDNYILAVEKPETAELLASKVDIYVVRPYLTCSISSSKSSRKPCRTYTQLYAYYKSKQSGVEYETVKPTAKQTRLVNGGYHFVNSIM